MSFLRVATLRSFARPTWNISARSSQPPLQRQYSTAKDAIKSSSSLPWALCAIVVTGIGSYVALQPRESASHGNHHTSDHESHNDESESIADKASNLKEAASEKKEQVKQATSDKKEDVKKEIARVNIKGERSGDSVKNHGIASEKNEHKIREGKFCDDEFDNHVTVHSADPGKDFEKIKKKKAE